MTQPTMLLTPQEASRLLTEAGAAIGPHAVREWIRSGRVRGVRLPGERSRVFVRREDIEAILRGEPAPGGDGRREQTEEGAA